MKEKIEKTLWQELFDSIKFCIESKKGKFSLDTYLDIMSEYTDKLIKESEEKELLMFVGGECKIKNDLEYESYLIEIKIYFEDTNGRNVLKEAQRILPKNRFTSETETIIGSEKVFEINRPI